LARELRLVARVDSPQGRCYNKAPLAGIACAEGIPYVQNDPGDGSTAHDHW